MCIRDRAPSEPWEQPRRAKLHQKHFHTVRLGPFHIMHLGTLKDLYGPQKGSFWLQKALLGVLEVLRGRGEPNLVPTAPHWPT